MVRICATEGCCEKLPPQKGRGKPREFCTTCRPPRNRANPRVIELPTKAVVPVDNAGADEPPLVASYRRQLEAAEQVDTPEGAHVMHLAMLFAASSHTASGAAALSRELRAAMEAALKDAPHQGDRLDELAERRAQKAGSA